jgi:hypothetical protein
MFPVFGPRQFEQAHAATQKALELAQQVSGRSMQAAAWQIKAIAAAGAHSTFLSQAAQGVSRCNKKSLHCHCLLATTVQLACSLQDKENATAPPCVPAGCTAGPCVGTGPAGAGLLYCGSSTLCRGDAGGAWKGRGSEGICRGHADSWTDGGGECLRPKFQQRTFFAPEHAGHFL